MTGYDRWRRVRHSATTLGVGTLVFTLFLSAPASFAPGPVADAQAQQQPAGKVYRIGFLRHDGSLEQLPQFAEALVR
jgi:hypothetical protein